LGDALQNSDLGDVETLTVLARLTDKRFIEPDASVVSSGAQATAALDEAPAPRTARGTPTSKRTTLRGRMPSWAWAALGLVLILLPLPWLSRAAREPTASPTPPPPSFPAAPAGTVAPAPIYSVASRVVPSNAEIWLDGRRMGRGEFDAVLDKDGSPHQLRVSAEGYLPTLIMFVDAPPPRELHLQPIPVQLAVPAPLPPGPTLVTRAAPARPAPRRPSSKATAPRRKPARQPRVQGIDADVPQIEVIE
jgi:hypothetical protein